MIGPSGSGKTTLLHVAGTLERPTGGSVRIGGEEVSGLSDAELSRVRARRLGFVFQQFHLLDHLDAAQNVALGLLYRGVPAGDAASRRDRRTDRVGLATGTATGPPSCPAASASGWRSPGQSSAVPTSSSPTSPPATSTPPRARRSSRCSPGLAADGTAVVVVTHDARRRRRHGPHVTMRDGRVVCDEKR